MTDPLHQFEIHVIAPLFSIFGVQFNFTNAALFMLVIVAIIWGIVAAVLYSIGKKEFDRVQGMPRTVDSLKQIPDTLKRNEENR